MPRPPDRFSACATSVAAAAHTRLTPRSHGSRAPRLASQGNPDCVRYRGRPQVGGFDIQGIARFFGGDPGEHPLDRRPSMSEVQYLRAASGLYPAAIHRQRRGRRTWSSPARRLRTRRRPERCGAAPPGSPCQREMLDHDPVITGQARYPITSPDTGAGGARAGVPAYCGPRTRRRQARAAARGGHSAPPSRSSNAAVT